MSDRMYADFQNLDGFNRLRLTCAATLENLANQGIGKGVSLAFYTDDVDGQGQPGKLSVEAIVDNNKDEEGIPVAYAPHTGG